MSDTENSSSSDEDADEKLRLSEAVFSITPNRLLSTFSENTKSKDGKHANVKKDQHTNKLSLRPSVTAKDPEDNTFTPGVRKFVASKLSEELDRNIELTSCVNGITTTELDTGIRLFFSSKIQLVTEGDIVSTTNTPKQKKRKPSSSSDSSEENERLAEAAVSHDFIMEQSRLSVPDNQKNNKGDITLSENQNNLKQGGLINGNSCKLDMNNLESVKMKKKKKKK